MCGEKSGEAGYRGEETERKNDMEVDGQCKCGLEREGRVGRGDATPGCAEETCQTHRPPHRNGRKCGGRRTLIIIRIDNHD